MIKHPIGIFISGRGSNLKSIVDACKEQENPAEIKVVFSNNKNAPGLSFAKENNLEAITLDYHNFKNTEEYEYCSELKELITAKNFAEMDMFLHDLAEENGITLQ